MATQNHNFTTERDVLKRLPLCPKCNVEFGYRVRRGFLFKKLLNWLPVKRYYCYKCKQKRYVWTY